MKTDKVEVNLYRIPLPTPIQAASTAVMTGFDMVMVRVWDSDGAVGSGYTVLHEGQGASIASIIKNVFVEMLLREDPRRIEWHWRRMWKAHHYAGRGGPVSLALAALDTALWDLRGRSLGEPRFARGGASARSRIDGTGRGRDGEAGLGVPDRAVPGLYSR